MSPLPFLLPSILSLALAAQISPDTPSRKPSEAQFSGHEDSARLERQANRLFAAGQLKAAEQTYRRALALDPENAELHFNLALTLGHLGDLASERGELARALQLEPNLAKAHNQLGLLAVEDGQTTDAETQFQAAIAADPNYAESLNNLGVLYSHEGRKADALDAFRRATKARSPSFESWVNLGLMLFEDEGFTAAEKELESNIAATPQSAGAYTALGVIRTRAGHADAVAAFQKAAQLEPRSSDAHLNLGMALAQQEDQKNALQELQEAARLNPNSGGAHVALGHLYFVTGHYQNARKELTMACQLQPTSEEAFYFLALVENQANNLARAAVLAKRAVDLNGANADAQFLVGQILSKLGKADEAVAHWKLAVQANPEASEPLYALVRALSRKHDPEAQHYQQQLNEVLQRAHATDQAKMLRSFALESARAQNWPQAIEQMQQAIELCGDCDYRALLHKNLAFLYRSTGRIAEAKAELKQTIKLDPEDDKARDALQALEREESAIE